MPKQLNVDLRFNADVSQAKQQIVSLQQSLNQLTNSLALGKTKDLGLTESVGKAIIKVQELQGHLNKAMNVNTGRIDFSKFNQSLQKSNTSLQSYASQLLKLGPQGQQAFFQLSNAIAMSEIPLRRSSGLLQQFGVTLRNTLRWQISSTMFHGLISGVRTAYNYAKDLNESLNNIRIVTGQSTEQMAKFAEQANKAAQALGTTTTKYTDAALIFYQQGIRDENEIAKRTDATIKMANVSGQSAEQVSSQLTAIWNNFADGSKSLEYYADVITALGASTASSSEEIAQGLSKFAAVADTVGLSYEKASAALATVVAETRQSADTVGTAFKTILARLESVNLGETLEDGVTLTKYSEALQKVGVNILDQQGHLKQMDTILDELGSKWQKLSEEQQVALANTVGGVRQYAQFMALMNNYDKVRANETTALGSRGTLEEQQKIYAESWEAASKRSKAALEDLYSSLINDKFFIQLTNTFTGITKEISNIIKSIGGLSGVLTGLGAILTNVFSQQLTDRLSMMGYNIKMMTEAGRNQVIEQKTQSLMDLSKMSGDFFTGNILARQYSIDKNGQGQFTEEVNASTILKQNYEDLIKLQIQLSKNSKNMSEEEIANAEKLLQIRGQINQQILESFNKMKQLENSKYELESDLYYKANGNQGILYEFQTLEEVEQKLTAIRSAGLGEGQIVSTEQFEELKRVAEEAGFSIDNYTNKIKRTDGTMQTTINTIELYNAINEKSQNTIKKLTSEYGLTETEARQYLTIVRKLAEATRENEDAQKRGAEATLAFKTRLEQAQQAVSSLSGMIVASAQGLLSVISIMTTLSSMIKTLNNPDASGWEKFTAVLRGTAMTILMMSSVMRAFNRILENKTAITAKQSLVTTLNTLAESLNAKAKEKTARASAKKAATLRQEDAAGKANTVNNLANAGSEQVQAASKSIPKTGTTSLGGAFKNFTGGIGNVIKANASLIGSFAAVAAAIAAVVGSIVWITHIYNEETNAAKEAAKVAQETQKAYETASESYDEFLSKISAYEDAQNKLKDLTYGTQEYTDEVIKANEATIELLNTYKDLKYTIENGLIVIDTDSLEKAEKEQQQLIKDIQSSTVQAKARANSTEIKAKQVDFARNTLSSTKDREFNGTGLIGTGGGAVAGALIGSIIPGLGTAIGAAIGAAAGFITTNISKAIIGANSELEQSTLEKLAELYNQDNSFFATSETLEDTLKNGLDLKDEELINSLIQNKDATQQLVAEMAAAKAQEKNANRLAIENRFGEQIKAKVGDNQEKYNAVVELMASRYSNLVNKLYNERYSDAAGVYTDAESQRYYAQRQGWNIEHIDNNRGNTGTYYDEQGNIVADKLSDEVVRRFRAEEDALNQLTNSLVNYTTKAEEIGKEDYGNAILAMLQGEVADFSLTELTKKQLEKYRDDKHPFEISAQEAIDYGYESVEDFWDNFYKGLNESLKNYENLEKSDIDSDFINSLNIQQATLLNRGYQNALAANLQEEFVEAINNLNTDELKNKFAELFAEQDWTSIENGSNFLTQLSKAGIDTNDAIEQLTASMLAANDAVSAFSMDNVINQLRTASEFINKLKIGDYYTEDQLKEGKINEDLIKDERFFQKIGNDYLFIGDKELLDFLNRELERNKTEVVRGLEQGTIDANKTRLENEKESSPTNWIEDSKKYGYDLVYGGYDLSSLNPYSSGQWASLPSEWTYITDAIAAYQALDNDQINNLLTQSYVGIEYFGDHFSSQLQDAWNHLVENQKDLSNEDYNRLREAFERAIIEQLTYMEEETGINWQNKIDETKTKENRNAAIDSRIADEDAKEEALNTENDSFDLAFTAKSLEELNELLQAGQTDLEHYKEALQSVLFNEMKEAGIEVERYTKELERLREEYDNLDDEQLQKMAAASLKTSKGFENLTSNLKKYKEGLIEVSDETADYDETLENFAKDLSLLLNTKITKEFAEGIKNDAKAMDLLEKAIEGNEEAYEEFQRTVGEHLLLGVDFELNDGVNDDLENEVMAVLDEAQASLPDLEVGATLDSTGLTEKFQELIDEGYVTAQQLSDALSTFGMEPEITWEPANLADLQSINYQGEIRYVDPATGEEKISKIDTITTAEGVSEVKIPVINGKKTVKAPPPPIAKAGNANKGKGGGGGSGGDRKSKELKKASDEIERYHKIDKTIDSLSKQYDRLSAAKDKAFGTSRLRLIERENALLQQQTEAEKARLEEVKKYYADDRSAIEAYGAVIDENGVISNYDEIMQQELDRLNAAYEEYNAGGLSDEIIEAKEKEYEEFKKILEQFEETNSEYLDQLQKVEEAIRAEITAELERIQAKVEVQLELPDQQLKMIEFKLSRLEDRAFSSGEKIALWGKQAEIAGNKFNILYSSLEEIFTLQDENGDWSGLNLTADQAQRLLAGDKTVLDEIKLTGENAAEIMEALKTKQDELIEQYNAMADAMKSIEEELTNQLDEYNEAIEKQISKMEKLGSIAQAMKDTINAVGKEVIGVPASVMRSINNNILKSSEARANAYKAEYEAQTKALIAAREALGKAQTEEDKKYWQDMIDTTEEAMNDAKESMLAQIQDYAEQAATIFEETLTESLATMAKNMYGMTVDDAQAAFDRYTTLSEDFLQDYQKIYELSKMTRSIQASINDTDNIKAKQALRDLQEEINEYQAEGVQMTQYEVDYLNKKYELRLAEIALEEAQNAKDQVRLSRNADGGWGYVYTANQQNIDQAQQSYEDKLKELQDLNYQMLQETQSGILGLQKEFNDALMEIYSRRDLSKEEQEKQINSLRDFYIRRAKTLGTSLDTALANNKDTYDFWSNNRYGYGVSAPSNYIDTYGETFLGSLNPALTSGANLANSFVTQMGDINTPGSIIGDSYQSWWDYTNEVSNMFGLIANDGETLEEAINREMTGVSEDIDNTTDKVRELAQTMGEELPAAIENVSNIQSQWGPVLDEAAELIENLGTAIEGLIEKMNEYNDIDLKPLDIPDSSGLSSRYTAAIATSDGGNGGGGSESGGGGQSFANSNSSNSQFNDSSATLQTVEFDTPWSKGTAKYKYSSYSTQGIRDFLTSYFNSHQSEIKEYRARLNPYSDAMYENIGSVHQFLVWVRRLNPTVSFDTGGYTGKFGPEGKLAMLHEKELVLNKQDTLNMLKMVALARDALGQVSIGSSLIAQTAASGYASGQTGFNSQNVSIEAHFPNVVDHNEIEQAFNNLANYAAQNAYNFDLPQRVNLF